MTLVIKDFLENKINGRRLFVIWIQMLPSKILEPSLLCISLNNFTLRFIKFVFNDFANLSLHRNNWNMVILRHVVYVVITLSNSEISMSFVSDVLVINHREEESVPVCTSIIHFKSNI